MKSKNEFPNWARHGIFFGCVIMLISFGYLMGALASSPDSAATASVQHEIVLRLATPANECDIGADLIILLVSCLGVALLFTYKVTAE